jgi:hypothetical protein
MSWLWNMGLWEAIGICLGFSFLVIAIDEFLHARRRRARQGQGSSGH